MTASRDISNADVSNTAVKPFKSFLELPTPDGHEESGFSYSKDSLKLDEVVIEFVNNSSRVVNFSRLEQSTPNFEEDLSSMKRKSIFDKQVQSSIAFKPQEEPESELMIGKASAAHSMIKVPSN